MSHKRLSRRDLLKTSAAIGLSLGAGAVLAACGGSAAPASSAAAPNSGAPASSAAASSPAASNAAKPSASVAASSAGVAGAPTGKGLTLAAAEQPESLDPAMSLQILNYGISLSMFDPLVTTDVDNKIVPMLATKYELTDPNTWKFTLRQGVKFHDGTPFTSASVKASLDRIVDPATKSPQKALWSTYASTETPDDFTAIIKTKEPTGPLLYNLALTAMVPPKPAKPLTQQPVGTGPFQFVEWKVDDHLTIKADPGYWGGAPKSPTITFRQIKELTTRITALTNGEVDIIDSVPAEQQPQIKGNSNLKLVTQPTNYQRFLWMNAGKKPFDNVKVRQAMYHAVDPKPLIQDIMQGDAAPATGCLAEGTVGYAKEQMPAYDPKLAKQMLADAGYPNGFPVEIKTADYLPKQKEIGETIVAQLQQIGIQAKLTDQDQSLWIKDLLALNWDMELIGTGALNGDGDYSLGRLYKSTAKRTGWSNPDMDKLLSQEEAETDPAKRNQVFDQACKLLLDQGPTIFLFTSVQDYGLRKNVAGFQPRVSQILYLKDTYLAS